MQVWRSAVNEISQSNWCLLHQQLPSQVLRAEDNGAAIWTAINCNSGDVLVRSGFYQRTILRRWSYTPRSGCGLLCSAEVDKIHQNPSTLRAILMGQNATNVVLWDERVFCIEITKPRNSLLNKYFCSSALQTVASIFPRQVGRKVEPRAVNTDWENAARVGQTTVVPKTSAPVHWAEEISHEGNLILGQKFLHFFEIFN